ncbi:ABC transporter permease [Bacillus sp. FJAT-49732]|uniref:ABC transporter permease n=1 Tax=Lederbergia citrisecunda TaxID=2833583 RepID=A0A942YLP3_9BACI|nr:ABC transporter permease [Lederbergia citrisecunda]MBS4201678.1 ABC transporter permease [Lederbergia citrisecunda]
MYDLMKLELKRNNIRTYLISTFVIAIIMLGFIYLFAYVPQFDPNDADLGLFVGYNNIISLFGVINMTVFCVLSSVVYSRFIIEEYMGKRVILLFSYPINRGKIFISKILVVSLFTIISMILCNILIFVIFGLSETISPLVNERITFEIITKAIKTTIIMAVSATGLSIIAMGIGFIRKSIPTTIISAFLLCSLLCNIVAGTLTSDTPIFVFMVITILGGIIVTSIVMKKVNCMEV